MHLRIDSSAQKAFPEGPQANFMPLYQPNPLLYNFREAAYQCFISLHLINYATVIIAGNMEDEMVTKYVSFAG